MTEAEMDRMMRRALLDAVALDVQRISDPVSTFEPSARHTRQMRQMLKDPLHWARSRNRGALRITAQWAAVVLLFVSLGFGSVMLFSAPARAAVERWVVEWYETHIVYRYSGESEGILPRYALTGLPEGFTELERTEMYELTDVLYGNESGELISFTYGAMAQGGATVFVPNDGDTILNVMVGKNQGTLFIPQDPESAKKLFWIDEKAGIHFTLAANLPEADVIELAESLRREKKR